MNEAQERHLQRIKNQFVQAVNTKYRVGAKEHGGDLMDMTALRLLDEAISENIDQFTYLITLRDAMLDHGFRVTERTADKYYGGTE